MNEQEQPSQENNVDTEPWEMDDPLAGDIDIDAALASVATLSDTIAAQEAEEHAARTKADAEQRALDEAEHARQSYYFARPLPFDIMRGQPASVVPALSLMALGAWLTFALSTDAAPGTGTLVSVILTGIGVNLLFYWLASGQWAAGALFGGLGLIATAVTIFVINAELDAASWPLLIVAIGVTVVMAGLLSRGGNRGRNIGAGVVVITAGLAAYAFSTDQIPTDILDIAETGAPAILIAVAAILLLPYLLRLRRRN